MANTIFLCGIAFMLGGNEVTQKNMKEEIDQDVDGKVFKNINNLIGKLGKLILKNIDEGSYTPTITDKFETNTIDNYDFYDEKQKFCERKNVIEPNSTD